MVRRAVQRDDVVTRTVELVERARSANVVVVWVQHQSDDLPAESEPWNYVP